MAGTLPSGVDIWKIMPDAKAKYDEQFFQLKPVSGFITGDQAKNLFLQSGLPPQILAHIWALADRNADGKMDQHEFAIAMHLIHLKLKGFELPKVLPPAFQSPVPTQMAVTAIRPPKAPLSMGVRVSAPHPVMANGSPLIGQGIVTAPPVSTSSSVGFIPSSSPVDAKLQRSGSVSSQDSPTGVPPPSSLTEWAIPQQSKLKYTQLFNSYDRTRTGFLTGAQARNILMQSGLPQPVLAQIWNLCDIDADGRLSCEEFVLAMHLTDSVKAGDALPRSLPPELIPPSFRRQRSASVQSTGSVSSHMVGEPLGEVKDEVPKHSIPLATFEDKRRENFEKGQAELERRRLALLESQRKEQEERQKKEREEQERRERIRQEQERRRQLELEKQLAKQREMEQEKEEQRRKALEQREAARREMERQRHLEWEKQRRQELLNQRQKEQEAVCHLKNRNKNLTFELEQLTNKINELNQKITDIRKGVTDMKSSIDDMRTKRDSKLGELNGIKMQIKEMNDHVLFLNEEKIKLMTQIKDAAQNSPTAQTYNIVIHSFNNKEITLNQLRNSLSTIDSEVTEKQQDVDNSTTQLKTLKQELNDLIQNHNTLYHTYEQKRQQILEKKKSQVSNHESDKGIEDSSTIETSGVKNDLTETRKIKYRALYAFEARNSDELSIMPGDIILVPDGQSSEPGWLGGVLHGKKGWFPEAYAEIIQSPSETEPADGFSSNTSINETETVHIVGTEIKRTLEGISEAPENGGEISEMDAGFGDKLQPSENSSFTQLPKCTPVDAASPIPGQGQAVVEILQAQALFPWKAKKDNHLTFNKGDVITVKEQQDMWWYGEYNAKSGWFPKSYVKLISGTGSIEESHIDGGETLTQPPVDDNISMYYTATYTYESDEPGDLCFQQGEVVLVTEKKGEWWTGSIGTRSGIFPSNYVRSLEPSEEQKTDTLEEMQAPDEAGLNENYATAASDLDTAEVVCAVSSASIVSTSPPSTSVVVDDTTTFTTTTVTTTTTTTTTTTSPPAVAATTTNTASNAENLKTLKKPEIVIVIAPYQATGSEQLSLQKGQLIQVRKKNPSGWWEGEMQVKGKGRQVGWFPASYVKPLGSSSRSGTPDPQKLVSNTHSAQSNTQGKEQVVAIYPFTAQQDDELTFQKGQTITLLSKDDASWWRGEINGTVGLFPSNYVEPIEKS